MTATAGKSRRGVPSVVWAPQEDNQLLFLVGIESPAAIAARLGRTERAVMDRYKAIHGGSFRRETARHGGMSVAECARALGVSVVRVRRWVHYGWLKARRRTVITSRLFTIQVADFEAFIRSRGGLLKKLAPTDAYWIGVLAEASADLHARYINSAGLASAFCVIPSRFGQGRWGKLVGFPAASFALQGSERWYERAAVRAWLIEQAPGHYRTPRALRAFGLEE